MALNLKLALFVLGIVLLANSLTDARPRGGGYSRAGSRSSYSSSGSSSTSYTDNTDGNTDSNTENNTDGNTDSNTENNTDGNTDNGTDGNTDTSTDNNTDGDTEGNTDNGTDGNTDTSTDNNTDGDTEGNTEDSESETKTSFSWTQTLTTGQTVKQEVFLLEDRKAIQVNISASTLGLTYRTSTIYDYEYESPLALTYVNGYGGCWLYNTSLTYEGIVASAASMDGTTAPALEAIHLDGTGPKIGSDERDTLFKNNDRFRIMCERFVIGIPYEFGVLPPYEDDTWVIKFLTFGQERTMTIPPDPTFG